MDAVTLAMAQGYTDESLLGLGAIKGKNCQIKSITKVEGGNEVVFSWTADDGVESTATMIVQDGETPVVSEATDNTEQIYRLIFETAKQKFITQNLRGESPVVTVKRNDANTGYEITVTDITGTKVTTIPDGNLDWDTLDGKPFKSLNPNDFTVTNGVLSTTATSEWAEVENKPFETLDPDVFKVEDGELTAEIVSKWGQIQERPFYDVDGTTITVDENKNLTLVSDVVNEEELLAVKNELTAEIESKADKDLVGTLEETGLADVVGVTNIATAIKSIDVQKMLKEAKLYTDEQIAQIQEAEAISVDEKPTYQDGTITYIKNGETFTTTETNIWFYYYNAEDILEQTIWIDGTEYTLKVGDIDLTDYVKKESVAVINPDTTEQEYTSDDVASMGMVEYAVKKGLPHAGTNINIEQKTKEETTEDGTITTKNYLEISADVVNVVEADALPADMKPTQLYARYGKNDDGYLYHYNDKYNTIVKYPLDDVIVVDNLPSYMAARRDRLYRSYTTDADGNRVLRDAYSFVLESEGGISWQTQTFEQIIDVDGGVFPETMDDTALYRLVETKDDGKMYRYSDKEEKTFAYLPEEKINNTYLRKDGLIAGDNIVIEPQTNVNGTIISTEVLTKVEALPETPNRNKIYQLIKWIPNYSDMRGLSDGGGFSYYYGFEDVETLPTAEQSPDANVLYRLPDDETWYGWDDTRQGYRTYTKTNLRYVESFPESYEAEDGILYIDAELECLPNLYLYNGKEWMTYAVEGDKKSGIVQVYELPEKGENDLLYQLMEKKSLEQYAFLDGTGAFVQLTSEIKVEELPTADIDDTALYVVTTSGVKYYRSNDAWISLEDYTEEFVEELPTAQTAEANILYVKFEPVATVGLYVCTNGVWNKYTPELTAGDNITIKDGVISSKPVMLVYSLPTTADKGVLYQICYDSPINSFATLENGAYVYITNFSIVIELPTENINPNTIYRLGLGDVFWRHDGTEWISYGISSQKLVEQFPDVSEAEDGILYRQCIVLTHPKVYSYSAGVWTGSEPEFYTGNTLKFEGNYEVHDPVLGVRTSRKLTALSFDRRTAMPTNTDGDEIEENMLYVDESHGATDDEAFYLKRYAPDLAENSDGYLRYLPVDKGVEVIPGRNIFTFAQMSNGSVQGNAFIFGEKMLVFSVYLNNAMPSNTTTGWQNVGTIDLSAYGYEIISTARGLGSAYVNGVYENTAYDFHPSGGVKMYKTTAMKSTVLSMNIYLMAAVRKIN